MPVIDHWWQTETGWAIAANRWASSICRSSRARPHGLPGYDVQILDEEGRRRSQPGTIGNIVVKLPLPPWHACRRCGRTTTAIRQAYLTRYPGYYLTGDAGYQDEDDYLFIMSRIDDVINVAGHRFSTGGMEEVLAGHPDVAECAVIGVADALKGELPLGLVVLKAGVDRPEAEIMKELIAGPRARSARWRRSSW